MCKAAIKNHELSCSKENIDFDILDFSVFSFMIFYSFTAFTNAWFLKYDLTSLLTVLRSKKYVSSISPSLGNIIQLAEHNLLSNKNEVKIFHHFFHFFSKSKLTHFETPTAQNLSNFFEKCLRFQLSSIQ